MEGRDAYGRREAPAISLRRRTASYWKKDLFVPSGEKKNGEVREEEQLNQSRGEDSSSSEGEKVSVVAKEKKRRFRALSFCCQRTVGRKKKKEFFVVRKEEGCSVPPQRKEDIARALQREANKKKVGMLRGRKRSSTEFGKRGILRISCSRKGQGAYGREGAGGGASRKKKKEPFRFAGKEKKALPVDERHGGGDQKALRGTGRREKDARDG